MSALYGGHRFSLDHDHVLKDLRERFDTVLTQLEAAAGWETARVQRPVMILGALDGIETGVRQLRRAAPLETTQLSVGGVDVILPTLPEALRIKAFLCLERNATRDYLDVAALASHMGFDAACEALEPLDRLYPQKSGGAWIVRTQLIKQFADPRPYDLDTVDLAEYKGVKAPFDRWAHVAHVCARLSGDLLQHFTEAMEVDPSAAAKAAKDELADWQERRARGEVTSLPPLPGLTP